MSERSTPWAIRRWVSLTGRAGKAEQGGRTEMRTADVVQACHDPSECGSSGKSGCNVTQQTGGQRQHFGLSDWYTLRLSPATRVKQQYKCWRLQMSSCHDQGKKAADMEVPPAPHQSPILNPALADRAAVETSHEGVEATFQQKWPVLIVAMPSEKNKATDSETHT